MKIQVGFLTFMPRPVLLVNAKTYDEGHAGGVVELARTLQEVSSDSVRIILAVSAFDLRAVLDAAPGLEVWCQHLDPVDAGSNTGWLRPETAWYHGAHGSLINHAEHKVPDEHIAGVLERRAGHDICVCAASVARATDLAHLAPTFLAIEPPELIGGDISVTTADPEIIQNSVHAVASIDASVRVLCGAGVKRGVDVATALALGAQGVLVASGVVKAPDARAAILDLIDGCS